ncbi:hypothetical protein CGK74_10025 [Thauera propionica]|uniref:Uncharacterized protein n=2 Tax=Thauera propionica TaxID=2019431 RepID=A0A235EY97_9RHOO|nr:hypothetical protein [Thauera propionica]OYD54012.1 hypothetical protein CGK74_10025 [Thauera propionica]
MIESAPTDTAEGVDRILEWLASEPADDPVVDIRALEVLVARLPGSGAEAGYEDMVLAFVERALDISGRIRAQLLGAGLPLPRPLHAASSQLGGVLLRLAGRIGERAAAGATTAGEAALLAALGLTTLREAYLVSVMSAAEPPSGLWSLAHRLAALRPGHEAYRSMIAIAAAQPERLTARELAWAADYLEVELAGVGMTPDAPPQGSSTWWIDPDADEGPLPSARKPPPHDRSGLRFLSPRPLARAVDERIEHLEEWMSTAEVEGHLAEVDTLEAADEALPPGLTPSEILALLRGMREHWVAPQLRLGVRREQHYEVQVCAGLRAMWELGRGRREPGRVVGWQVRNESPGGYAIMNVSGVEGEVAPGIVLGLRKSAAEPWTVCIVRWVRSDSPEQIEIGLQTVAQSYYSVQLAFRSGSVDGVAPALALPPMEPDRHHPAFLAPAGTYVSRRFVFVREGPPLYVAQGRALGLDVQTASVELFQYEIDPYPI